jgi:ADP-ribose pyrophosphatase
MPNGKKANFDIVKEGKIAIVFAMTPEKMVILAKQFRPGWQKFFMELPGGAVDKNEKPIKAAARELLEETGYQGEFKFVSSFPSSAYSTAERYCFVATNCKKVAEPKLDSNEYVETKLVSLKEFKKILKKGALTDVGSGFLALDYLKFL